VNLEGKRAVQKCRLFGLTYLSMGNLIHTP